MNLEAGSCTQNVKYCCTEIKANNSDITRIPQGKLTRRGNGKRAFELLPVCFIMKNIHGSILGVVPMYHK